jgi:ABC-type transport system involved in cytochrome c biogenesis permease subunit
LGVVTVHVITSVGMFGVTATLVVGQVQARSKPNQIWDLIGSCVLTPMAVTAFVTGLLLAAPWGLLRWHWIICKLRISAMLAVVGLANLVGLLDQVTVVVARVCALVALVAMVAVSMAKPWGRAQPQR